MIKINELRIGNLVKYSGQPQPSYPLTDGIVVVEEVLSDGVNRSHGDMTLYEGEKLEGIALSPEWLERCGFADGGAHDGGPSSWKRLELPFGLTHTERSAGYSLYYWDDHDCIYCAEVDYLHHLQNLYFALTGEELQIKP